MIHSFAKSVGVRDVETIKSLVLFLARCLDPLHRSNDRWIQRMIMNSFKFSFLFILFYIEMSSISALRRYCKGQCENLPWYYYYYFHFVYFHLKGSSTSTWLHSTTTVILCIKMINRCKGWSPIPFSSSTPLASQRSWFSNGSTLGVKLFIKK